jgi:hypothetical protein
MASVPPGFSVSRLLSDPGFQNLLAGVGQKLDPEGVGGALGGATIAYNQSQVAAKRAEAQEKQRNEQTSMLTDVLKRMSGTESVMTPKGQPGVTSIQTKPDGSLNINADVPGPSTTQNQIATTQAGAVNANPTVAPVSAAGATVLNAGTPAAPQVMPGVTVTAPREPAVPAAETAPVTPVAPTQVASAQPFDIRRVIPFS